MDFELTITYGGYGGGQKLYLIALKIPSTGEIRELSATTVEAGLRKLGRTIDRDFKQSPLS